MADVSETPETKIGFSEPRNMVYVKPPLSDNEIQALRGQRVLKVSQLVNRGEQHDEIELPVDHSDFKGAQGYAYLLALILWHTRPVGDRGIEVIEHSIEEFPHIPAETYSTTFAQ